MDRLEASLRIDTMSSREIVRIIQEQDHLIPEAVERAGERIAQAIDAIADRMRHQGRLFYIGAGTSGRIAMLDASELRPTYGVADDLVHVIMAGGERAFLSAAEGAEDRDEEAIEEVNRRVKAEDCVVGIAASGTTPFTVAGVRRANMLGALTVGITSIAQSPLARDCDIPIVVETGPEVIMGSSRMKSGTAQKLVLNMLSTGVMILLGKVYSNLMIEMPATNTKLRDRAIHMIEIAAEVPRHVAAAVFESSGGRVKESIVMARKGVSLDEARKLISEHQGRIREVLGG